MGNKEVLLLVWGVLLEGQQHGYLPFGNGKILRKMFSLTGYKVRQF
jgi:hypothetical protein